MTAIRKIIQPALPCSLLMAMVLALFASQLFEVAYGKTFLDANGRIITVDHPFTRIISLYSAHTENLCSLGGKDLVIGISRSDDFPPYITNKPRFSYREDPEKLIAANPDLVLIRPLIEHAYPEFIKKLRLAGIHVISLQPRSLDEMFAYWQSLGIITGKEEQVEEMIDNFTGGLTRIQDSLQDIQAAQRPRVYFQSIHKKMKTFANKSIAMFVLEQAGGINIATDALQVRETNIAFYGKERLLSRGPEIDILLVQQGRMNPVNKASIFDEPGFEAIKAVREKKVYLIEEALVSRPTLRILDGIERLNAIFYQRQTKKKQRHE